MHCLSLGLKYSFGGHLLISVVLLRKHLTKSDFQSRVGNSLYPFCAPTHDGKRLGHAAHERSPTGHKFC